MDQAKRDRLVADLSTKPEPLLVPIDQFFDGNDDLGSIGCNLVEHPGIEAFERTLSRIFRRADVQVIYARISELDVGEDRWPFTDTVLVVGTLSSEELASELASLKPDEVGDAEDFGVPQGTINGHSSPVLAAWWD